MPNKSIFLMTLNVTSMACSISILACSIRKNRQINIFFYVTDLTQDTVNFFNFHIYSI